MVGAGVFEPAFGAAPVFCDDFLKDTVLNVMPMAKWAVFRVTGVRPPKPDGITDP